VLFVSSGQASGSYTQMGFSVADIDAEARDLKQRGGSSNSTTSRLRQGDEHRQGERS